jgi:DNA processing protein
MNMLTLAQAVDWLRLWRLVQQSSQSTHKLLDAFLTPAAALAASPTQWRAVGLAPVRAARLWQWQQRSDAELLREMDEAVAADIAWCEMSGHALLSLHHPDYPALLREISDAPPLLFLCGNADLLVMPQVAIVGSRNPSLTGKTDAHMLARELASTGCTITSGMARGIDAAAHKGAMQAGGKTIAVLGTGADRPYPRENAALYADILANNGLVLSEFLPGTPPLSMHFPRRNRIISGLSMGVLVVEAAPESGSLITARLAGEQGRQVWALPGSRHHVQAQGCLKLIREGATAITSAAHILADLPPMMDFLRAQLPAEKPMERSSTTAMVLAPEVLSVLDALGYERRHADWLITETGQSPAHILRALSVLELAGLIAAVPGGYERLN